MRLELVTAEIRPRSDWEAVDLGFALVRRDFWRCLAVWWLALMLPVGLASWWFMDSPAVVMLICWWLKPVGSRMVLFEISRRLFGEEPSWRAALREIPRAWVRRFFYRLIWARLSPWLPVVLAVEDLEGLRGKAYQQRRSQVGRRGDSVVMWIYLISDLGACWFGLAILVLVMACVPSGQDGAWRAAMESWDSAHPMEVPSLIMWTVVSCVMVAMSLVDLFVIGAGFGVYINNRTWIEGWDVELAFKRMAKRLSKAVVIGLLGIIIISPQPCQAAKMSDPVQVMREVKSAPEFKVHTVKEKVPVETGKSESPSWLENLFKWLNFGHVGEWFGQLMMVVSVTLLVGLIGWLVWINRHVFKWRGLGGGNGLMRPMARVVMGMEISPETLPDDIPGAVLAMWRSGAHHDALGLLYRGAISRVIHDGRVEIQESDTEGDCVRRVDDAGTIAHPDYFSGLTMVWVRMAYASRIPRDQEVEWLCQQWPFGEGRRA